MTINDKITIQKGVDISKVTLGDNVKMDILGLITGVNINARKEKQCTITVKEIKLHKVED